MAKEKPVPEMCAGCARNKKNVLRGNQGTRLAL